MPAPSPAPLPCFLNSDAGNAAAALDAIAADDRLQVRECRPATLAGALREAVQSGAARVAVAGGDGTVAAAAEVAIGTGAELAIIPAGTLNHFARSLGIPTDPEWAVATAATGRISAADVGYVNDRLFLNTSSVGVYVRFVHTRDRYERHTGYYLASAAAALRTLLRFRAYSVEVEVDGARHRYRSPLVFVGVGEREARIPVSGERLEGGRSKLHVIVPKGRSRMRLVALGVSAAMRGLDALSQKPHLDTFLTERCTVIPRVRHAHVAIDGEEVRLEIPLRYRLARGALKVVVPAEDGAGPAA